MKREQTDIAIIGGGYYGAFVANEIKRYQPDSRVIILEKEAEPFTRASSTNQGQFHMGYMYSGDPELARECADNIGKFSDVFGDAVDRDVTSLYGIHKDSQISASDYAAFCEHIGLPLQEVGRSSKIFGDEIATVFASEEKTFNSAILQKILMQKLVRNGVTLVTNFEVQRVAESACGLQVIADDSIVEAGCVFNVTFADINTLHERSGFPKIPLKHDTFLHFVLDLPSGHEMTAASVIRGPYASLLPSSFRQGHILASGRFRRVQSTTTDKPLGNLSQKEILAIRDQAMNEASTYLPIVRLARYRDYTLGTRAAHFDPESGAYTSKALVFRDFSGISNYHVVLGGKVSCMFDIEGPIKSIVG